MLVQVYNLCLALKKAFYYFLFALTSNTPITNRCERGVSIKKYNNQEKGNNNPSERT